LWDAAFCEGAVFSAGWDVARFGADGRAVAAGVTAVDPVGRETSATFLTAVLAAPPCFPTTVGAEWVALGSGTEKAGASAAAR
jgi:hypothetical protein